MAARVGSLSKFGPAKASGGAVTAFESAGLDELKADVERLCRFPVLLAALLVLIPEREATDGLGICEVER